MSQRGLATEIFLAALQRLRVEAVLRERVSCAGEWLRVGALECWLGDVDRVLIVAIGKAARPMAESLLRVMEDDLRVEGVVVAPAGSLEGLEARHARVRFLAGGHPLPDAGSRQAGDEILRLLATCDARSLVLFLISGGASAMVEKALDEGISLEKVSEFHMGLVRSGLPITKMNALRKHFSAVKGGRLAQAARGAKQGTVLISDVPGHAMDVVGSGPSLPDSTTVRDCREIVALEAGRRLPEWVREYFMRAGLAETPKAGDPAFARAAWTMLLSSEDLGHAAADLARARGFYVEQDNRCDDWDYEEAAGYLLGRVEQLRRRYGKVCLVSVGEVTVHLPHQHGCGGRNQQFVLECARRIAASGAKVTVLSAGSDGVDGMSLAAGAVCDETTWQRAWESGLDAAGALTGFDSGPLLEALGDAIVTGPTGNNLRDLRLLLVEG